jgi:Ca-activated chloride channel family protein
VFSSQFIEHFHFLRPAWALLLLPTLVIIAVQWRREDQSRPWQKIIAPHLLEALRMRQFGNRWFNPSSLSLALMLLMITMMMGPSWRQQASPLTRDEAALVILLDVSPSMQQRDIQPSRLARARQKISDLLELRQGTRTALVAFAGSAHTVLTLTNDNQILAQYLQAIDPKVMPRAGKFPEYALPLVDQIVGDSPAPTSVLLLTDGVSGASETAFSDYFNTRPHQLLVWGIGASGDDVPPDVPPLETDALQSLAAAAGGNYREISIDDADVAWVQRRVDAHYVVAPDSAVPWLDAGYWLVFPCLAMFALWFRRGWTLHWSLAGLLLLGLAQPQQARADEHWFANLWLTPDQHGRLLFQRGDYVAAANRFRDPLWKGLAYYYAEDFKLAAEYFSRVDSPRARFNRGNALAQSQNYLPARRVYDGLLDELPSQDPLRPDVAGNRALIQDIIDAINNMSESQQEEQGDSSKEMGEDDPERAEGAERKTIQAQELVQFSADEVLQDEKVADMWMRSVQRNPSNFLAIKFSMQLEQRE